MLYKPSPVSENVGVSGLPRSFPMRFDGELLAPFVPTLLKLSPVVSVEVSDGKLKLRVPFDAGRSVELALPAEREVPPKLNPPMKARACAFGVFDETLRMLRKVRGSEHVKVRVSANNGALVVEPPRRVFRAECSERVEVRVFFGDLKQAIEFFDVAGFAPSVLMFSESVLALETEFGRMKLRALIAGQLE